MSSITIDYKANFAIVQGWYLVGLGDPMDANHPAFGETGTKVQVSFLSIKSNLVLQPTIVKKEPLAQ